MKQTQETFKAPHVSAVQHERKPMTEKRDFPSSVGMNNSASNFSMNPANKIFIRKDLALDSKSPVLPPTFTLSDLGLMSSKSADGDNVHRMSPGQVSIEEDGSTDSFLANDDLNDAYSIARDKNLISRALETVAKNLNGNDGLGLNVEYESEGVFELEGVLLLEQHIPFNLQTPSPMPAYLNVHYICESASRLLFLSVHWARSIPAFQLLSSETHVVLVRSCWAELFALGLAQCSEILSLPTILSSIVNHLQASMVQEKISTMHIRQVEKFQEKAFQELRSYVSQTFPEDRDRFPRLLLRLPPLRALQPQVMEELFFAGLIGNVQIDSVIPYILRMGAGEYSSQLGCFKKSMI
ncbi:Nuclear receptor subfamily 2 group C member 2 [Blattella germanica]|nr:Nuclear receptor subfamily 2 group C member 2 [Blattella germanica]